MYNLSFPIRDYGLYTAAIVVNGTSAHGSPLSFWVAPSETYPWFNASRLISPRDDWQYLDQLEFGIVTRNFRGQRTNSCEPVVEGVLQPARKRIGPSPADVAAQVECHLGSSGSAYRVWIVDEVEDGNWLLYVKMDGRPVVFSPMAVTIRPGVSAKESVLSGPGLRRAVAGVPADVFLSLRMQNDVPALDCREAAMLVLVETWASSDVAEDEPGHRRADSAEADSDAVSSAAPSHRSLTGELVTCSKGEYHFSYTATAAGNYSLSVLIGRQKRLVGGGDFNVVVVPGLLSPQHCEVEGGMLGLGAALPYGATVRFRLLLRDALGNRISC